MESGVKFIQDLAIIMIAASVGAKGARWAGVSPLVGYLLGGLAIGGMGFIFIDLTDPDRLRILTQIGIVFVMFSMGLNTRLSDLRLFGTGPFVAVALTALIMLSLGRFVGGVAGLSTTESLFFTAMLMISSSTTINKHLVEMGLLHQRAGQMARGQTMLESVLAIALICVLSPLSGSNSPAEGTGAYPWMLLHLGAFAVLFVVVGMLLIPTLLRRATPDPDGELQTIFLVGILFTFSMVTVFAGYPLALGAFLTGLITSEIPRSQPAERLFTGVRDVFTAVFFVTSGMTTDLRLIADSLGLILLGTLVALGGRFIASTIAWTLACETGGRALRIAMLVTPAGAFSLIIAKVGIENGAIPARFHASAVGIVVLTGVLGAVSMRLSDRIRDDMFSRRFDRLSNLLTIYRSLWESISKRGGIRFLWSFIKPRVWQVSREILCITAVLLYSKPGYAPFLNLVASWLPDARWVPIASFGYWFGMASIALPSLVALLRNLDALCMIVSDYLSRQSDIRTKLRRIYFTLLRTTVFGTLLLWLMILAPWNLMGKTMTVVVLIAVIVTTRLTWRWLIRIHHQMEVDLSDMVEPDFSYRNGAFEASELRSARQDWDLHLKEFRLPDFFFAAGRSIEDLDIRRQTGATIIGIDRQGLAITRITALTQLFSGDTLFLLGTRQQIQSAVEMLNQEDVRTATAKSLHRAVLRSLIVAPSSPLVGRSLADLNWARGLGVQILAIRSGTREDVSPPAKRVVSANDKLLMAGTEQSIKTIRDQVGEFAPNNLGTDEPSPFLPPQPVATPAL